MASCVDSMLEFNFSAYSTDTYHIKLFLYISIIIIFYRNLKLENVMLYDILKVVLITNIFIDSISFYSKNWIYLTAWQICKK